ncbi:DUF599 domain-containing protein [Jannaschia donghaensis]|uniref:Uncharacterized protein n=1 Tax=Jannaschia donghaensis TaxID=420998 RepID=A0A0M6YHQ1_9RHOB|nr:DUF599 domain-containing protein [Jannaschia donghaensis]CTQ48586.1 hypothetical protein JDO7802_00589 [Jannaschia donghaensis]
MLTLLIETFVPLDLVAVALLLIGWLVCSLIIEHPPKGRASVTILMQKYRHDWMDEMLTRQPRIFDATLLSSLRQGTTFMTSASMIAVGGVLAMAGNAERLDTIIMGVGIESHPATFWQVKLGLVALVLTHAVFKFIWSNRLFGYCAVVMASVPNDPDLTHARPRAQQAAELNIRAAMNFNRGLRSVYFAFAALGWLLGPWGLMVAVAITAQAVLSREFASTSRDVLLED